MYPRVRTIALAMLVAVALLTAPPWPHGTAAAVPAPVGSPAYVR